MAEAIEETKEEEKIEEVKEDKIEEKEKKEVKKKKGKKRKGLFSHYKIEGDSLKRLLPFCERCGIGYFMADHCDRYTCGHCGFTRYKPIEAEE